MEKGSVKLVVFNCEDFGYWKNQTRNYLLSQGRAIWEIVKTRYVILKMLENEPKVSYKGMRTTTKHSISLLLL
jgi:hypothetical protein